MRAPIRALACFVYSDVSDSFSIGKFKTFSGDDTNNSSQFRWACSSSSIAVVTDRNSFKYIA